MDWNDRKQLIEEAVQLQDCEDRHGNAWPVEVEPPPRRRVPREDDDPHDKIGPGRWGTRPKKWGRDMGDQR